ncbi:MAG: alpha-ribazole phosphatase [Epulopiscium sp.]|nr:alpha-ribazole phosphatase [Candidatus Epulonipiscium sp.]
MKLYLVRHGETNFNQKGVYYGWKDILLCPEGEKQIKGLRKILPRKTWDCIISSPLQRAIQTVELLQLPSYIPWIQDERLKEIHFGQWEGKHYKKIQKEDPVHWEKWIHHWQEVAPPKGESYLEFYNRVENWLLECIEQHKDQELLVISHQGCLRIILSILLGLGKEGYWYFSFESGAYTFVEYNDGHCIVHKINQKPTAWVSKE